MRRDLMKAVREVWRALGGAFDPYRPAHVVALGPGPKCRAKRAGLMAQTAGATAGTGADFAKLHA